MSKKKNSKIVEVCSRAVAVDPKSIWNKSNKALISISTPPPWGNYVDFPLYEEYLDKLILEFDDVSSPDNKYYQPFTTSMAEEVVNFIEKHNGVDFVVHCDMGLSRSVAVSMFMRDCFEYDMNLMSCSDTGYYNKLVYDRLKSEYSDRNNRK